MNDLQTQEKQLPSNIEDLTKFVLVGREKLNAVRAEIRAIQKVGLAKEVHEQKLIEAQEIAEAVLDAEVKIGELTAKIPKATPNNNPYHEIDNAVELVKPKNEALQEIGIPQHTAERFERLARHPETVEKAKEDARAEGRIVTRADVLNRIVTPKTHQQTLNEFKRQAHEEHEQFQQAKQESAVSLDEVKKDKQNQEIINLDTLSSIKGALLKVSNIGFLPAREIDELIGSLKKEERADLQERIAQAMRILAHISNKLGG